MNASQADGRIADILNIKKAVFVEELPEAENTTKKRQASQITSEKQVKVLEGSSDKSRGLDNDLEPPKKKARRSTKPDRVASHQNSLLKAELKKPLSTDYRGIIKGSDEALALGSAYEHHLRRDVPSPEEDSTWPVTDEMRQAYVRQLYDAIMDVSDFQEKADALQKLAKLQSKKTANEDGGQKESKQPQKRKTAEGNKGRFEGLNATDSVYANPDSTPTDILQAAARCYLTNVEVEILS